MGSRARARVLIVDDDEAVRLALRLVLDEHHDVLEAGDGGAALDLLDRSGVDVVVLDLLLPKTDGFQVLQRLHALPRRLAFGATPPPMIERGVRHLARAIRERLREPGRASFVDATTAPPPGSAAC